MASSKPPARAGLLRQTSAETMALCFAVACTIAASV
jgi:hypothetical protein